MTSAQRRLSVREHLYLLVLATVLPGAALFAWFLTEVSARATEAAHARVKLLADGAVARLELVLSDRAATLERFAARPLVKTLDPRNCDSIIGDYAALHPEFTNVFVRDANANLICSRLPGVVSAAQTIDFQWFRQGLHAGTFNAGDAFAGRQTGRWVSVLTYPVRSSDGRTTGLVGVSIDLLKLQQQVLSSVPQGALVAVVDRAGTTLLRSAEPERWIGRPDQTFDERKRGLREGFISRRGADGVARLYAFVVMPNTGWRVEAGLPEAEVYAAQRALLARAIGVSLIAFALVLALAWWIARAIGRPIHALAKTAARVAAGDTSARAHVAGPAEIEGVAEQLNHMLEVRERNEEALQASEQRWKFALEGSGDGVWDWNVVTTQVQLSRRWKEMLGYAEDEMGSSEEEWAGRVHPEDLPRVLERLRDHLEGRSSTYVSEHRMVCKDGSSKWMLARGIVVSRSADGSALRMVGTCTDLSQIRRMEQALRDRERFVSTLMGNLPGMVYRCLNDPKGTMLFVSEGCKALTGYEPAELERNRDIAYGDLVHAEDRDALWGKFQVSLARRLPFDSEYRIVAKNGEERWVWERAAGIYAADGTLTSIEGFVQDITERKQAEAARLGLEEQLRISQKMEAVGTLAGGIAHDFNNILGAILGNAALARQDIGPGHAALPSLEQIGKAALRARSLVQQILAFSRKQPQQLFSQALRPLIEESLALLRSTLPATVRLEAALTEEPLFVRTDATQMQQVLMNLCTNAWHALPGGAGRIEVSLKAVVLGEGAAGMQGPEGLPSGRYALLCVRDNGSGMSAATRARIFEPFFTTKPVGEGTGLGLSVVHGIVAAHQGALTLETAPGEGSSFELYFPLQAQLDDVRLTTPGALDAARGRGEHVLYVDDDEVMVELAGRLLERLGYRVSCFQDAQEAVAAVRAQPFAFDLAVTDFNMPNMSGLDVARALAEARPDLPVLISSGHITETLHAEALEAGVRGLLQKERTFEDLGALVSRALAASAPQ